MELATKFTLYKYNSAEQFQVIPLFVGILDLFSYMSLDYGIFID